MDVRSIRHFIVHWSFDDFFHSFKDVALSHEKTFLVEH